MSSRRRFSVQYKDEAVQLVIQSGRPVAAVARELGINDGTLGNWVNAWKEQHPDQQEPLTVAERARLREIEEDNRRLKMENEFLKKAAAFFAKTQP